MKNRRSVRLVFGIGFVVALLDGAALVWLGQLLGRGIFVGAGVVLLLASAGVVIVYRRWMKVLDDIEVDRREARSAFEALRDAVGQARTDRWRN